MRRRGAPAALAGDAGAIPAPDTAKEVPIDHPLRTLARLPISAADLLLAALLLLVFRTALTTLVGDWWTDPDSDRGLLLAPLAIYLAVRIGLHPLRRPQPALGLTILGAALALRLGAEVAVERYALHLSLLVAAIAVVVLLLGARQVARWWLPLLLLWLVIPLPNAVWAAIAMPLQLWSAAIGAALLGLRGLPVETSGTVIQLPGHTLLITEGCSGLRSITTMLAISLLAGEMWLRSGRLRALLVLWALPIALLLNGVRIFITGFVVFFVGPEYGAGAYHTGLGWVMFLVNALALTLCVLVLARVDTWRRPGAVA
jgi:exosortase